MEFGDVLSIFSSKVSPRDAFAGWGGGDRRDRLYYEATTLRPFVWL